MRSQLLVPILEHEEEYLGLAGAGVEGVVTLNYDLLVLSTTLNKQCDFNVTLNSLSNFNAVLNKQEDFGVSLNSNAIFSVAINKQLDFTVEK
jgi:hypothetical protein